MQVKWTRRAAKNLESALAYIAEDNPKVARELALDFLRQIDQLKAFPNLGRAGSVAQIRELVLHENYVAYYRVKANAIEILRVLHARNQGH
jgi:toxin ParE1/3/4